MGDRILAKCSKGHRLVVATVSSDGEPVVNYSAWVAGGGDRVNSRVGEFNSAAIWSTMTLRDYDAHDRYLGTTRVRCAHCNKDFDLDMDEVVSIFRERKSPIHLMPV